MNKRKGINELCNLLSRSLRHRIGSILFEDKFYANKYAKDSQILFNESVKVFNKYNFNMNDKSEIKQKLTKKLILELTKKDFIPIEKFKIMGEQIKNILDELFK